MRVRIREGGEELLPDLEYFNPDPQRLTQNYKKPYDTYLRILPQYLCLCHQLYKSHCLQLAAPAFPLDDRLASPELEVSLSPASPKLEVSQRLASPDLRLALPELEVSLRLVSTDQAFHRFGHSLTTVGQVNNAHSSLFITD
jgi:hypothetical protein